MKNSSTHKKKNYISLYDKGGNDFKEKKYTVVGMEKIVIE